MRLDTPKHCKHLPPLFAKGSVGPLWLNQEGTTACRVALLSTTSQHQMLCDVGHNWRNKTLKNCMKISEKKMKWNTFALYWRWLFPMKLHLHCICTCQQTFWTSVPDFPLMHSSVCVFQASKLLVLSTRSSEMPLCKNTSILRHCAMNTLSQYLQ